MATAATVTTKFTAKDNYSSAVAKMSNTTQAFASKAQVAVSRTNRMFTSMMSPINAVKRQLGSLGLFIGGAALIGAIGGAINIFKDFEQANANLASVMSSATGPQLKAMQEDAIRLGSTTAKTASEVVGLQEAFARLGFETPQILNMTEATISGSIAMRGELADTAELVGAVVKTFDKYSDIDTSDIVDKMTLSTQKSALNFEKLQTALPIVGGAANAAGVGFDQMTASLGVLSDAGIDASSSSTALRNIFLVAAKKGVPYEKLLQKVAKSTDKLKTANELFGKRGAVAATILAKNMGNVASLAKVLETEFKGTAATAADKQLATLGGSLTILGSAYEGFILSMENGNGAFSNTLKNIVQVATEMLSLASGTAKASGTLNAHEKKVRSYAETAIFVAKVIGYVVAGLVALKIITIAATVALGAYNIALGIMGALSGTASIAIGASTLALGAYKATLAVATAAQTAWAVALNIGIWPLTLIALGIALLITLIVQVVKHWDEWGAALTLFLGPLGFVISLIQSFRRNWDLVVQAFESGGILGALKAIGKVFIDAVLMPLQQLLSIASKLPGTMGEFAAKGASAIESFRADLGLNVEGDVEKVNPKEAEQNALIQRIETTETSKNELTILDQTGRAELNDDSDIGINLIPSLNFGN